METNNIKTIEMTRAMRDKNARELTGKTQAERIAFYQEKAAKVQIQTPVLPKESKR